MIVIATTPNTLIAYLKTLNQTSEYSVSRTAISHWVLEFQILYQVHLGD